MTLEEAVSTLKAVRQSNGPAGSAAIDAVLAALEADISWQEERNRNNVMAYSDRVAALEAALDPFVRIVNINAGLNLPDPMPFRDCMPGTWPTLREVKELLERARVQPAQDEAGRSIATIVYRPEAEDVKVLHHQPAQEQQEPCCSICKCTAADTGEILQYDGNHKSCAGQRQPAQGQPPAVCTGSGSLMVDFLPVMSSIPSEGKCGICGQTAPVFGDFTLTPHPYQPAQGREEGE